MEMRARALAPLTVIGSLVLALCAAPAHAQPRPADVLREGNEAATAGDWDKVSRLVDPLTEGQLSTSDLAEAHRLAGLAAYFQQHRPQAESHFLAYLRLDLDGHLDPALYPPEVIAFFDNVKTRYGAELRARRPRARRWFALNLIPMAGQFQNGERTKGWIFGGVLGGLVIGNVASYLVLRSWCSEVSGRDGSSLTCDKDGSDHYRGARVAGAVNVVTGIALIATYVYGVWDGVAGYRQRTRELAVQLFMTPTTGGGGVVGLGGQF